MSSQMYELLKRKRMSGSSSRPRNNTSSSSRTGVRTMAKNLVLRFPKLPDDAIVTIEQVNEESIHRHNAFAERMAMFGELKEKVNSNGNVH